MHALKPQKRTPAADTPGDGKLRSDKPRDGKPGDGKPLARRPAASQPVGRKPSPRKPGPDTPAARKPGSSKPRARKSAEGYSGTPLPKKLGIKQGMTVALVSAPPGFSLGDLPEGAKVRRGARGRPGLVIWFVGSRLELGWEIRRIAGFASGSPLWIAWRKQSAKGARGRAGSSEPSESAVREAGLESGLVDYKVCAIDAEWSGLLFAPRRSGGAPRSGSASRATSRSGRSAR